jgi:hypothetical protein
MNPQPESNPYAAPQGQDGRRAADGRHQRHPLETVVTFAIIAAIAWGVSFSLLVPIVGGLSALFITDTHYGSGILLAFWVSVAAGLAAGIKAIRT